MSDETSETAYWLILALSLVLPTVVAGVWWRTGPQPYRAAAGGLFASGVVSFTYWFWVIVAPPSLEDFAFRASSSEWVLTVILFGGLWAIWALGAGAGAAVGSRFRAS